MAHGSLVNGDYFIDCPSISQSTLRAIFGVWVNVCVAVIALCLRYIYRSHIRRSLLLKRNNQSVWYVSPAVTPTEVFELRSLLFRAVSTGRFGFVLASVFCIVAAAIGAASTVISNYSVVTNTIQRNTVVQGTLVTSEHSSVQGAIVPTTSRIDALNKAGAPLTELFDFAPSDDEDWLYNPSQWNNTWQANCTFNIHRDAELHVYPTNTTAYQDEAPSLGDYIPPWATIYPDRQAVAYAGFYEASLSNGSGVWRDKMVTYVFASWPGEQPLKFPNVPSTVNISLVNYLAHRVGRDGGSNGFEETMFKTDVHLAECAFVNTAEGGKAVEDQAMIPGSSISNAASNIVGVYHRFVVDSSIKEQPVTQPTGQEMLRYFQAHKSVKDSQYPHPKSRILLARRKIVQVRLSTLVTTIGAFLLSLIAAGISRWRSISTGAYRIHLPSSQLDWIVQAAREHARQSPNFSNRGTANRKTSPAKFASENEGIAFIVTENLDSRILSPAASYNPTMQQMTPGSIESRKISMAEHDPWSGYAGIQTPATPMSYEYTAKA